MNTRCNDRSRSCHGYSLIEALVALLIFSVAILGVMGGLSLSARTAADSLRMDRAIMIAERELTLATLNANRDSSEIQEGLFRWSVQYDELDYELQRATVVVTWMERSQEESFRLSKIFHTATTK